MSLGLVATIISLITGILAYISHLRSKLTQSDFTIASLKNASKNKEWDDEISKAIKTVAEKEIDYKKTSDDFRNKYPDDSGSNSK